MKDIKELNKALNIMLYSAFGTTLPPLTALSVEYMTGKPISPAVWMIIWAVSMISLFIVLMSLLYFIICVLHIDRLYFNLVNLVLCLFHKIKDKTNKL